MTYLIHLPTQLPARAASRRRRPDTAASALAGSAVRLAVAGCVASGVLGCSTGNLTGHEHAGADAAPHDRDGERGDGGALALPDAGTADTIWPAETDDCAAGTDRVYLLDDEQRFVRFDPEGSSLETLFTLDCPGADGAGQSPFSMSVDRSGHAWVIYLDGQLYRVSIDTGSCEATSFVRGQQGMQAFGMGFVSDAPGSSAETLYVAGLTRDLTDFSSRLATIDLDTLTVAAVGSVSGGQPELTGNSSAELWGYFPHADPPAVRQLDKDRATVLRDIPLAPLAGHPVGAWAFAHWGGDYFVFAHLLDQGAESQIWRVDPDTSAVDRVVDRTGHRIVGAGVSTCAPVTLF